MRISLLVFTLVVGISCTVSYKFNGGNINYDKGIIELANLEYEPDKLFYNNINHLYYIKLFAEPNLNSLKVKSNNVLVIENSSVKASMI